MSGDVPCDERIDITLLAIDDTKVRRIDHAMRLVRPVRLELELGLRRSANLFHVLAARLHLQLNMFASQHACVRRQNTRLRNRGGFRYSMSIGHNKMKI